MAQTDPIQRETNLLVLFSFLILGSIFWGAVLSPMVSIIFNYGYELYHPVRMVISIIIFTLFSFAKFFLFEIYNITAENDFKLFFYPIYNLVPVLIIFLICAQLY